MSDADLIFGNLPRKRLGYVDDDDDRARVREALGAYAPEGPMRPRPSGKGGPSTGQGATGHSSQALAYLARTTGGNEGGNGANIATLIDGLVADGVWAKLDALYVLAQQNRTDALLNLEGTSYPLTPDASTFVSYQGFHGFTTGLDTGLAPSDPSLVRFTLNSASAGFWSYTVVAEDIQQIGTVDGGVGVFDDYSGPILAARINNDSAVSTVPAVGTKGIYAGDRPDSASVHLFWNGADQGSSSNASATLSPHNIFVGSDSSAGHGTAQTISAAFIGGSLGSAGQLALYNRLRTYMTAVGVP